MAEYNDIKERVASLAKMRDRNGLEPLTYEERIGHLNEIYDGLLFLWKQCVVSGTAKGTAAIGLQLERARLEMKDLRSLYGKAVDGSEDAWGLSGFDLPKYDESLTNN